MTSLLMSVVSNDTSFNRVFNSASIDAYHVTLTSIFRLLPVSTYSDFRSEIFLVVLNDEKKAWLVYFFSKCISLEKNRNCFFDLK